MYRIVIAAAFATVMIGTADAGSRHKHRGHHGYPAYAHAVRTPQVGPIWAGPNQCWTDEGYGRYWVCSGRR